MNKKVKLRRWARVCVIAGLIVLAVLIIFKIFKSQENIYFLEYESEYEKDDTLICQYNSKNKTVVEIGRVQGELGNCVINSDETCITGLVFDEVFEIVRYDLATGACEKQNAARNIDIITDNKAEWTSSLIYNGGNKIFISFKNENRDEKWLLYDLNTDQYDIIEGETGVTQFLTIHNDDLWYIANGRTLYKYDLEKKKKTLIMESVKCDAVVMPETGLVAYTKDAHNKQIFLYDIWAQETRCIAGEGWNTCYGELLWTNSRWSDNGREFFYIKYFPGLFNEATTQLMVYNVITQTSRCIYKVKMTTHEFQYVMKR